MLQVLTETQNVPLAVVMISLNEGHNLQAVCDNLRGWAQEIYLVDSYSRDDTIDIALRNGVKVVQRRFRDFGDQWNWALDELPIQAPWTMKLDPDERITPHLKQQINAAIAVDDCDAISVVRRLWFMGKPMPVRQPLVRVWRTGQCRFTDVAVNEHPIVTGKVIQLTGEMEHHDSPDLFHWLEKQNRYTTAEATMAFKNEALADNPRFFGTKIQRVMWLKKHFRFVPFRYSLFFLYNYFVRGSWRAGWVGYEWAQLRSFVMRMIDTKRKEMELAGHVLEPGPSGIGDPDARVEQQE